MASEAEKAVAAAQKILDEAVESLDQRGENDSVGKLAAAVSKAETALNKAKEGVRAENSAVFLAQAADARVTIVEGLQASKVGEAMHVLFNAGIRRLEVSFLDDGSFTMDEKRAKGMREGGTRNVDKYSVNGSAPLTAARLIETFGPSRDDFEERSNAIADGSLKRKAYAEEITEDLGGEVIS